MKPSKATISRLKEEVYLNAVRLLCDACRLYIARSYASACALSVLSLEETGKLLMTDHICDDISINPQVDAQEFVTHLLSHPMWLSHKNKQVWATINRYRHTSKRVKDAASRALDRLKQDAFYVGYQKGSIRSPRTISRSKAYAEITDAIEALSQAYDMGFTGFDGESDAQSRRKAKRQLRRISKLYQTLGRP